MDITKVHRSKILVISIIILNVADLILHIAINQPETLRITSNVLVISSGILLMKDPRYATLFALAMSLYIVLNAVFVVLEGIGTAGTILIAATVLLGIFILRPSTKRAA